MSKQLPPRPSLEYLKKEARALQRAHHAGDPRALRAVRDQHPRAENRPADLSLQEAQLVVARQYGFESWPRLVAELPLAPLKGELDQAIRGDDAGRAATLVSEHPELMQSPLGRGRRSRPLSHAADLGQLPVVRALLPHASPEEVEQAFGRACFQAHLPVARFLLEERPALSENLKYALFGPCEALRPGAIPLLIELGADPNAVWENSTTPLDMALCTYSHQGRHACVEALVQGGARFEEGPEMDIHRGRLDLLEKRLDADPDLVHRHSTFRADKEYGGLYGGAPLVRPTLLHICAEYGELEAARLLLDRGADPDARCLAEAHGTGDQTPLFHAITANHNRASAVLELLVDRGAAVNARATLRVPRAGIRGVQPDDPLLENIAPLGYALHYPNEYQPGPGSGAKEKLDRRPHDNVVELLRRRGAAE